jgi:hypothetical protein
MRYWSSYWMKWSHTDSDWHVFPSAAQAQLTPAKRFAADSQTIFCAFRTENGR